MTYLSRHLSSGCGCDDLSVAAGVISIDQALQQVLQHVTPVARTENAPIHTCRERVLAAAVLAHADMPRFDHSAMDGYAVNSKALAGDGPWLLPVNGRVAAGEAADTPYAATDACRIFTGAPVPHPFDSVIMQEKVERLGNMIRINRRPTIGENIRLRGEEHRRGAEILPVGMMLTPRAIAAAAAAGHGVVNIRCRIRVTLLASGSEVAASGTKNLTGGQIWDVNTPMLQSLLSRPDVDLQNVIKVDDDKDSICCALQSAAATSDLIITTGGVSVGDEDHLRTAVTAARGDIFFAGVAIKPGKPVALGKIGDAVWLGLPGNPGSAFVTWSVIGETVLNTLAGNAQVHPERRHVVLGHSLSRKAGRCEVRAARIVGVDGYGRDIVECPSNVNSGQVSLLATSDGLSFLPSETDHFPEGALVEFLPFSSN
ncbi:molybdopterin molybdotransferase MoeA [Ruegeria profundi]|uniref:molybdopterin molybdotransferase MoeA n=1 Tax=Ruegeria profundi TaxID=1685378 RepID=UPI001CD3030C|nr:molybdopterin molybdotransferase MoeA [Ruegeria profundi]MCA0928340.1 molybdopterin molybdotransferase MoeA [Ruegeria profundi]